MESAKKLLIFVFFIFVSVLYACEKKEVPALVTIEITEITANSAKSGGNITSDGGASVTVSGLCWCTGIEPTIDDDKTIDGSVTGNFTSSLTELKGGTNYYVRAYAINSIGTGYGSVMSFTTLGQAPTATTETATNITISGASLNGTVNANYLSTSVTFEYGTTSDDYSSSITSTQSPITGNTNVLVSADLTDLNPGTTYHFRIKAVNICGTSYSSDKSFTSLGKVPSVITSKTTNISTVSSTLNGIVNANYLFTDVKFEYGLTTEYDTSINATPDKVTGSSNTNINAFVSKLEPGTIYHFTVKAINSLGTTYGSDSTFTTLGNKPLVTTSSASSIFGKSATLNGIVNANYLSTDVKFEYGLTTKYDKSIKATPDKVTGNSTAIVSADLSDLSPETTYHFRVLATNSLGTTYGNDSTLITVKRENNPNHDEPADGRTQPH